MRACPGKSGRMVTLTRPYIVCMPNFNQLKQHLSNLGRFIFYVPPACKLVFSLQLTVAQCSILRYRGMKCKNWTAHAPIAWQRSKIFFFFVQRYHLTGKALNIWTAQDYSRLAQVRIAEGDNTAQYRQPRVGHCYWASVTVCIGQVLGRWRRSLSSV